MKRCLSLLMGVLLVLWSLPFTASADFVKTKVAVLDFQLQGEGYETKDMGSIVAEWFITALVKEGRFDVVERAMLQKILNEQKMAMSGIIDESSATQLGKILGVKVIISGSVMKLQNILEVNARIIDVETASIIAAENVKSTASTSLQSLIVQMSEKIIKNFPLEGYIISRSGKTVAIDLGLLAGVKDDMEFMIFKEGKVIKHPKTGEVLDVEKIQTGKLKITSISKKIATATITEEKGDGAGPIAVGNMVKSISGELKPIQETPAYTPAYTPPPPVRGAMKQTDYIQKLESPNLKDKVYGAKKIIRDGVKDPAVLDVLEKVVMEMYNQNTRDRNHVDAVAWMVKALGAPGLPKYNAAVETIAKNANNRKIRGYAQKALGR
ncbi:MAG: CsgG/HfaB family protein [Proteobacteria bacterium]|nr:CsgG/HfaB family protein [Pseudomonadota bacterium]MBU1739155.1 CsgG/HfaB family protein [Pseudomonadota bacterium]